MENLGVELIGRGQTLGKVKIKRGIFQGDLLLPLQIDIVMMSLNYVLRICTKWGLLIYVQITRKVNHYIHVHKYMDDIKVFAKNEKEQET